MNNKGFAITTVVYSILILLALFMFLILGNLRNEYSNQKEFTNGINEELNDYLNPDIDTSNAYTGIPCGVYNVGDEISYGGETFLVVADNGDSITIITKSNIGTGAFGSDTTWNTSSAKTAVDNWLSSNPVLTEEATAGGIVYNDALQSYARLAESSEVTTSIPNNSATAWWTMTPSDSNIIYALADGSLNSSSATITATASTGYNIFYDYYGGDYKSYAFGLSPQPDPVTYNSACSADVIPNVSIPTMTIVNYGSICNSNVFYRSTGGYCEDSTDPYTFTNYSYCGNSGINSVNSSAYWGTHPYICFASSNSLHCKSFTNYSVLPSTGVVGYRPVITVMESNDMYCVLH